VNWIRRVVSSLAQVPDTSERTAIAFSLGVFIGFSPLLGFHTILGVVLALLFRLNRVAVLSGVWINVPWVAVPYYTFATWAGIRMLGMRDAVSFPEVGFSEILSWAFWVGLASQWRLLIPAFAGSLVLSCILAGLAYPFSLWFVKRFRAIRRGE
jgi:uncharacterized protein (DUF2062 family)